MNKSKWVIIGLVLAFSGCATMNRGSSMNPDQTAQAFFDDLQRSDYSDAYGLLGKGLSQRISSDQFEQFMKTIHDQWGRIETDDTAVMPFHRRAGEENFIPMDVTPKQVKRYIFDVKFENAEMNFDLTLAPQEGGYKIVWFSIWGSNIYLTPQIREKIQELFSNPDNNPDQQPST